MRQLARRLPFLVVVIGILSVAAWYYTHRDRIVGIAPGVMLSWNGRAWDVLDARTQPDVGIEAPPVGGLVLIEHVAELEKSRDHLVGKTEDGRYFIMSLRKLGRDEDPRTTVTRFQSEREWRDALSGLSLASPSLRKPAAVANAP